MGKRTPLGKGMESLIRPPGAKILEHGPEEGPLAPEGGIFMVEVGEIHPNPFQPRKVFHEGKLKELSDSIKENGVLQPLVVDKGQGPGFTLIAGERRLRAAKMANVAKVPVVVRRSTDQQRLIYAIIENIQRDNLNCVEEARAYGQLLREFRMTQEELAKKLGLERSSVANILRILKLPGEVVELLREEKLSFGHGKVLAGLKNPQRIVQLAMACVEEGLSVKDLGQRLEARPKGGGKRPQKFHREEDAWRQKIEQKTGLHVELKRNTKGQGKIVIHFSGQEEFGHIFTFLTER